MISSSQDDLEVIFMAPSCDLRSENLTKNACTTNKPIIGWSSRLNMQDATKHDTCLQNPEVIAFDAG